MRSLAARLLALIVALLLLEAVGGEPPRVLPAHAAAAHDQPLVKKRRSPAFPSRAAIAAARRFVRTRKGDVAFAVIDSRGRLHGLHVQRRYRSASVTKAMLLVAYLRKLDAHRGHLTGGMRGLLGPMVRYSDNDAASSVYRVVGDGALQRLGRRAGMTHLGTVGHWAEAWITAADQARFFKRVRRLLPARYRRYGLRLLKSVVAGQRWGIARAAPRGFRAYFKGGWRPEGALQLEHQAGLVERGRLHVSIAVLSTGNPGHAYGARTIERIATRLLHGAARHPLASRHVR